MADVLQVEAGDTLHLLGWSVDGALGAFVELESTVPGSPYYLVNDTAGVFTSSYLIISDAQASADALWTADATCADFGGNSGWFDAPSPSCGDRLYIEPGDTLHATGWSVDGAPGANILLTSYPPSAAHFIVADSGGPFTSDYLNILWSDASPDADWTALSNCFDGGNNRVGGWFGPAENTLGVVLWLEAWAVTAGVTTDSQGATVVADTAAPTAGVTTDAAATDLWFEAGFNGEVPNVFSVIVWMEAWAATTETRADTYAADVIAEAVQATGGATADSGGAEVAVDLQAPSTSVPGDVGGAGAVLEAGGAAGSAQGYVQAAGVDVCGAGVGAGVLTGAVGNIVELLIALGETVISASVLESGIAHITVAERLRVLELPVSAILRMQGQGISVERISDNALRVIAVPEIVLRAERIKR